MSVGQALRQGEIDGYSDQVASSGHAKEPLETFIVRLQTKGFTYSDIAYILGISKDTVYRHLKAAGRVRVRETKTVGRPPILYEYAGDKFTLTELAFMADISPTAMRFRLGHWESVRAAVQGIRPAPSNRKKRKRRRRKR